MTTEWTKEEFEKINIGDERLNERAKRILRAASKQPQASLNTMFCSRKEVQACYRFFSNNFVDESKIISPHLDKTIERISEHKVVLKLNDTTSLNFTTRKKLKDSGYISSNNAQGFFLHLGIAVTPDRLHLGVTDYKLWSREKEKPKKTLHRDYKDLEEKESYRWLQSYIESSKLAAVCKNTQIVHITDREGDIFEIFEEYQHTKKNSIAADFIIRSKHNRSVYSDQKIPYCTWVKKSQSLKFFKFQEKHENIHSGLDFNATQKAIKPLKQELKKTKKLAKIRFKVANKEYKPLHDKLKSSKKLGEISFSITKRDSNETREVCQSVRATSITLKSGEGEVAIEVQVNAIYLEETNPPAGEKPVIWRLLTSLPINTLEEILTVIKYYLCRWEIEIFFKTYKSGCKVEEKSLRDANRLFPLFSIFLIVAWRVNYLLHISRIAPEISCEVFFEPSEWKACYVAATRDRQYPLDPPTMREMMGYVAKLGGHLGRKNDPEPGPKTIWIGISKLTHYADAWDLFGPEVRHKT